MVFGSNFHYNNSMKYGLKNFFRNSEGISLIQVLLASSAIAGLAVVGLQIAKDQKILAKRTYHTYLVEYYLQEVTHLLTNNLICEATFSGKKPDKSQIDHIKEPIIVNGEENGFHILFPSLNGVDGNGSLFSDELEVVSYSLSNASVESRLKKSVTNLEVTINLKEEKRKIIKTIPLSYKLNSDGGISSCTSIGSSDGGTVEGIWKTKDDSLILNNLTVVVGGIENRDAGVSINGTIGLQAEDQERPCTNVIQGLLTKNSLGQLVYCYNERWEHFGKSSIQWNKVKKYQHGIKRVGSDEIETLEHRFCYLTQQTVNSSTDGCNLQRLSDFSTSKFVIKAFSSAAATNLNCEVFCVD